MIFENKMILFLCVVYFERLYAPRIMMMTQQSKVMRVWMYGVAMLNLLKHVIK